jgi:ribonuclease HII
LQRFLSADTFLEAGCDEAGRGPLAGPVLAAAVILPRNFDLPGLNDSKKLDEKTRFELEPEILKQALAYGIAQCSPAEIDQYNILNASILAMHRALDQLSMKPDLILVDGNRFKNYPFIPHQCVVKGDSKFASIAAASILAKTNGTGLW